MNKIEKIQPSHIFTNYVFKAIPLAFDESMSYYETLCGVLDLLHTHTEVINNNAELLAQLESYVEHYFENLDVQEEINNKLDEMAEDGTLENLISQYLQFTTLFVFDTVNDLKNATNIVDGNIVKTMGYYELNDEGESYYLVRNVINTDIVDDKYLVGLHDENLVAQLIIGNEININQLGITSDNDCSLDINNLIDNTNVQIINFNKNDTYTFETTINLSRKIKLNFNNATCNFTHATDYMFNISTNYANKPIIENLHVTGLDTNGFIYATIDENNAWGVSYILKNSIIEKFLNIITAKNMFNAIHENNIFNSDYGYITLSAYDMSNDNVFNNCYFKGYNMVSANYPNYKFIFTNVKNIRFNSCAFEHFKGLFNLVSGNAKIVLQNCEIEQFEKVANTYNGLDIDGTNMLIGNYVYSDDMNYKVTPRNQITPIAINLGNVNANSLRNTIYTSANDFGSHEISYVENSSSNSAKLYDLSNKAWSIYLPINIIGNKTTNATSLATTISSIFSGQNGESSILTMHIYAAGSDGGRVIWKSQYIVVDRTHIYKLKNEKLVDSTWSSAVLYNVTFTESITDSSYTITLDKTAAVLGVKIKFEGLGEKIID